MFTGRGNEAVWQAGCAADLTSLCFMWKDICVIIISIRWQLRYLLNLFKDYSNQSHRVFNTKYHTHHHVPC